MKINYQDFGYTEDDILMNPCTGSVDTAKNWALESARWNRDIETAQMQFSQLIHVVFDEETNYWIEA